MSTAIRVPDTMLGEIKEMIAKRKGVQPDFYEQTKRKRAPGGGRPKGSKNRVPLCSLQASPPSMIPYEDKFTILKVNVTQSYFFRLHGDRKAESIVAIPSKDGVEVCSMERLEQDNSNRRVPSAPEPLVLMFPVPKTVTKESNVFKYDGELIAQPQSLFDDYANVTMMERTKKRLEFQRSIRSYELQHTEEPELNCFNFYNPESNCREKCVRTDLFSDRWNVPWYECENVEEWCIRNDVHHGEPTHDRSCDECNKPPRLTVPIDKDSFNESDFEDEMADMYANGYRSDD